MRLSRGTRRALAYISFWATVTLTVAVIFAFPKVIAALAMIACGVMLLVTSWQLVSGYINE